MKVVGVDGCRGGWVAMCWNVEQRVITPKIHKTLAGLIKHPADAAAIGIDMPIGLSDTGTRRCDVEARRLLGPGRASSVFPPPIRDILHVATHKEANTLARAKIGKGIPIMAFCIFPKIAEANATVTPEMQDRVFEVHPEVSFWALGNGPMRHPKRRQAGYDERKALLEQVTGLSIPTRKEAFALARPAKPDDILDATVAAWTARRVMDGKAGRLPEEPEMDSTGLRMEIVY
jgi:predicted RNase H-like nuclease